MITAKVGINNLDSDALTPAIQPSGKVDGVKSAIFVNATYIKDSLAGHGTALGTKYSQRSLILNTLFNPNISQFGDTTYLQGGVEGAWLMPFGNGNMLVQTEANAAFTSSPTSGNASVLGAMIQATVKDGGLFDYGIRASLLMPRELSSIGTETISEITPSLVYHIDGDNASIIVDAPILLNTAVKVDSTHHGLYEITNVTNSVSGSGVFRTTTYALRIMGQFLF
jgi:hypothetical protein